MALSVAFVQTCAGIGAMLTFVVVFLRWFQGGRRSTTKGVERLRSVRAFRRTYLTAYLMATMGDWLQGPYLYALYESYGFSREERASFFISGFSSSALFGTYLGILADTYGRRAFAMLYCVLYIVACLAKHVQSYFVLMIGHAVAGMAISLLYSVFDSWLVAEHRNRGFDQNLLGGTFASAVFYNSIVAVIAGELGEFSADVHRLKHISGGIHIAGYCTPFDVSAGILILCLCVIRFTWNENSSTDRFEDKHADGNKCQCIMPILASTISDPRIFACGIVCSMFEASMFVFVVCWTPSLQETGFPDPPFGHVFAVFMIMCMLGSRCFDAGLVFLSVETLGIITLLLAASSHLAVVMFEDRTFRFVAFLLFEVTVGMYFPMIGTLKGRIVPEESRSAIYSLYRVPLNISVLMTLLMTKRIQVTFATTAGMLLVGCCAQAWLRLHSQTNAIGPGYEPVSLQDIDDKEGADTEHSLETQHDNQPHTIGNAFDIES